jgi:hypothetical protein
MSRQRRVAAVTATSALLVTGVGATLLSDRLMSPQQAAASAQPPARGPVTTPIENRALETDVVTRGRLTSAGSFTVRPAGELIGQDSVVTRVAVHVGQHLTDGQLIADVSGQPLFAAPLPFPLYRDLSVGDTGPDVTALGDVLRRAGLVTGRHDRVNPALIGAVATLLRRNGYAAAAAGISTVSPRDGVETSAAAAPADGVSAGTQQTIARRWFQQVPATSATVAGVGVRVGTVLSSADEGLFTLRSGRALVVALLDPARRGSVRVGTRAVVSDDSSGISVRGVVRAVGTSVQTQPSGDAGLPVTVDITSDLSSGVAGRLSATDLRVSFTSGETGRVLAVPTSAVYTDVTGTSTLRRVDGTLLTVTVGSCESGWCPVRGDGVRAGDLVVLDEGPR